jgi:hypothetical protein
MFGKLCSILALALTVTAVAQVRVPIRIVTVSDVLAASDFTYQGMIRMPLVGVDTSLAMGGMSGRQVAGDTHLFIYSNWGGVDEPGVYEIDVTGLTPNTTLASAPRSTLVTDWGVVFDGHRTAWEDDDDPISLAGSQSLPHGLYWHEANQLLYWGFAVGYTGTAPESIGASSLDDNDPVTVTGCGSWRYTYAGGASTGVDGSRTHYFTAHPTTGKMLSGGISKSGNAAIPWGPSLVGGQDWPTCATPAGATETPLSTPDKYLNYYYPDDAPYTTLGAVTGTVRQFKFPVNFTYAFENFNPNSIQANPATAGYGTWSDENSSTTSVTWFNGTHKKGVIYTGTIQASTETDLEDCTNSTHLWYRNESNGYIRLTSASGSFAASSTITGGTSGSTANVTQTSGNEYIYWNGFTTPFTIGETVTGPSGSGTVSEYDLFDTCNHQCACVQCATGPSTTRSTPVLIIYDPDDLEAVKAGSATDYATVPEHVIDVEAAYGVVTAAQTETVANHIGGAYLNGTTLYLHALRADCTRTGNCNFSETVIHVFTIDDSAPPPPVGHVPVLPMAGAMGLLAVRRLTGGRASRRIGSPA